MMKEKNRLLIRKRTRLLPRGAQGRNTLSSNVPVCSPVDGLIVLSRRPPGGFQVSRPRSRAPPRFSLALLPHSVRFSSAFCRRDDRWMFHDVIVSQRFSKSHLLPLSSVTRFKIPIPPLITITTVVNSFLTVVMLNLLITTLTVVSAVVDKCRLCVTRIVKLDLPPRLMRAKTSQQARARDGAIRRSKSQPMHSPSADQPIESDDEFAGEIYYHWLWSAASFGLPHPLSHAPRLLI